MNCERSNRRDWLRQVAMGLGRKLTKQEENIVTDTWRAYRESLRYDSPVSWATFPPKLVERFSK